MKTIRCLRYFTLILASFGLVISWVLLTNAGLDTAIQTAQLFTSWKIKYTSVSGTLMEERIILESVTINDSINAKKLIINWRQRQISAEEISGIDKIIPKQEVIKIDSSTVIKHISGSLLNGKLQVNLEGFWQENLKAEATAIESTLSSASIEVGKNKFILSPNKNGSYNWELILEQPENLFHGGHGSLYAKGKINNLYQYPQIEAVITSSYISIANLSFDKLTADISISNDPSSPILVRAVAKEMIIDSKRIDIPEIKITGTSAAHKIKAQARYLLEPVLITADAHLYNNNIWKTKNIYINYKNEELKGSAEVSNKLSNLKLSGELLSLITYLDISVLNKKEIEGEIKLASKNLDPIMKHVPEITRLKGNLIAKAKLSGTINSPKIETSAHLTEITATFPEQGIKVKPMELHLISTNGKKFILSGTGSMRRGSGEFTVDGFFEPFEDGFPNQINIRGDNIEVIKNATANLLVSTDLKLNYDLSKSKLDVTGKIDINKGYINFDDNKKSTTRTKDVVFVDYRVNKKENYIEVNPDISLRIIPGVKFKGFNLDAEISGKVAITKRNKTLYGAGRISTKNGTFTLPGQKLTIEKGRLIYPPGTILSNPNLDIKMLDNNSNKPKQNQEQIRLFVQGTVQKPIIHETGITGNSDKAISQALNAGGGIITNNKVTKDLDFGISSQNKDETGFFDDPVQGSSDMYDKDITVGRSLGHRFYIQYLHSMGEANKRVRLQYALGKYWAIGLESGEIGAGLDLSFSIEH